METEKIDVPKFEGFECIGVHIPIETGMDVYVLSMSGTGLHRCPVEIGNGHAQLCYRKIKPKRVVFERVGPGIANAGEWIRTGCGDFIKLNSDRSTECDIWHQVEEKS